MLSGWNDRQASKSMSKHFEIELVTAQLTKEQILTCLHRIPALLEANGYCDVFVEHGWGSDLPIDEMWKPIPVKASLLIEYLTKKIDDGTFTPGSSDLFIFDAGETFRLLICHEHDIHLSADDAAIKLRTAVEALWEAEGIERWTKKSRNTQ